MKFKDLLKILSLLPFNYWYDFDLKINNNEISDLNINLTDNSINFVYGGGKHEY